MMPKCEYCQHELKEQTHIRLDKVAWCAVRSAHHEDVREIRFEFGGLATEGFYLSKSPNTVYIVGWR